MIGLISFEEEEGECGYELEQNRIQSVEQDIS